MTSNTILILNSSFYFITLYFHQRRKKRIGFGSLVFFVYFCISIIALLLFNSRFSNYNEPALLPFVYLFIIFLIFCRPLLKLQEERFGDILVYNSPLLNFISVFTVLITIVNAITEMRFLSFGSLFDFSAIADEYENSHQDLKLMVDNGGVLRIMYSILKELIFPLLIYNILSRNKGMIFGLSLSIMLVIVINLANSSRSGLASILMSIPYVLLIMKHKLDKPQRKKLAVGIVLLLVLSGMVFFSITYARFGQEENDLLLYSLENYTGQSMLIFNNYGMEANGIRYGDRTAPLIRMLMGMQTSTNYYERRETYSNMLVNDGSFYTFVGDFTLDYGPVIAFLLLCAFALFFGRALRYRRGYSMSHIFILYAYYIWIVRGFALWPYGEKIGNCSLMIFFMIFILLRAKEQRIGRYCSRSIKGQIC